MKKVTFIKQALCVTAITFATFFECYANLVGIEEWSQYNGDTIQLFFNSPVMKNNPTELFFKCNDKKSFDAFFEKIKCGTKQDATPEELNHLECVRTIERLFFGSNACKYEFDTLPPEICEFKKLTQLEISDNNKLSSLPPEIGQLTSLKVLRIHYHNISSLPPEIGSLKNLTNLSIAGDHFQQLQGLTSLPPAIGLLENLTDLSLSRNQLSSLPPEFAQLKKLRKLDLTTNNFSSFPDEICKLTKLTHLYCYKNKLSSLPNEIVKLKHLEVLTIDWNLFSLFPVQITKLRNLTFVGLCSNLFTSIPPEIGKLTKLHGLIISGNRLSSLPMEIGSLTNLQDLSCNNNRLISLPHQIANLTNLHKDGFSCDKNPLQYVPKSLKKLEDERKFGYLWNKPPFDASLFMDSPPVPQPDENGILSIGHPDHVQWFFDEYRNNPDFKKQIQKAVKRIEYTDFFEELVVPMPILRMYPGESEPQYCLEFDSEWQVLAATLRFEIDGTFREEFKKTQNINFIGLGLTKIPPFVFQCRNIEKIFLERNQIKELPEKIALLEKLTFLGLGCNNLQQLPLALERLDKLRVITLDLNPFDHPYAQMPHLERLPDLEHISVDGELAQRLYGQCKCSGTRVRFRQLINQSF